MPERIHARHVPRARFMRPEPVGILPEKMVVIALIHDNRDFGCIRRTLTREIAHNNRRIVPYDTCNEIWTRLRIRIGESPIPCRLARLVKRDIAVGTLTATDLPLIKHVHCVGETVVRGLEPLVQIPAIRLILGLRTSERRNARTLIHMVVAEGFALYRPIVTLYHTLTLILFTGLMKGRTLFVASCTSCSLNFHLSRRTYSKAR